MMMEVDDEQEGNEMDVSNANFISSLSNPLRGYAETCFPPQSNGAADEKESIPTQQQQRLDEFEISVRSHLLELIEQLLTAQDNDDDDDAALTTLLQYLKDVSLLCLHISIKTQSSSSTSTSNNITAIKKLPFLLIEDTIDSLPLTLIQRVWSSSLHPSLCISSYINNNTTNNNQSTSTTPVVLTSPQLFIPTSKFVLLRICNKLLRLLSSSNNNNDDANFAGEIMLLLAQVFPLSERSAMNVLGGFNVGNVCRVEGLEEFEQRSSGGGDGGGNNGGSGSVGYEFYSKFWGVQKVFTDPAGTILTSSSSSARGGGGGGNTSANDRVQAYESFIKDVTDILEAFESTPIVEQDNKIGDGNDKNQSQEEKHPVQKHHKYLTNSQLLHLQLKDPTLRIHFLTQLLIILSYLSTLPPSLLPTGVQSTAGADTSKLMGQIRQTQLKQLGVIEKRVQKLLLRATTSAAGSDVNNNSGSSKNNGMWKALQWILRDRESMWKNWKKAKCLPAMDRVTTTTAGGGATTYTASGSDVQKLLLAGKKRKLDTSSSTNPSGSGARSSSTDTFTIETLAQVTSEIKTSAQPTLTAFFDPYVEALDPENGIEGEYHPKNDKVYTWRGLRLMARDYQEEDNEDGHLKRFGKLRGKDGDFEGIVRDIWKEKGEEIPGKMPEDYYQEDIEEEEEVSGTGAGAGGKTDAEIDDVSVGSTQEAAIAKKEEEEAKKKRMAEFEKAAMEVEEDILDENEKAVDEGTKSNRSSYASLADAVVPNTKSEESAKEDKKKDEKPNEVKKDEKTESKKEEKTTESKKEDGKDVKKEENGSKKGSPNSKFTKKGTPNSKSAPAKKDDGKNGGGKGKKEADNGKKDESKGSTKTNSSKGSDNNNNNKNDSKQQTRSRAKFTPPQKVQQQHQNKSEPQRDNSNFRGGGGGGGGGGRRGGNDRRGNNMPPPQPQPPQSRGGNRDGHGRAHTPPGGPNPRGGDQRGNNGPPRGGGGPGRGWEPPPGKFHPGQGGGGGRGGGGGGRPRRHGRR